MSGQRMGWFSMNGFTIAYDPPLSSFEKEFKAVLQKGIKNLDNVNIFYRKGSLLNQEDIAEEKNILASATEEFLRYGFYGLYSFFILLQRFEFYFLFAHKYERYLQKRVQADQLEVVFEEIDKMESDFQFLNTRLMEEVAIGIFVIDTKDYKDTLLNEIRQKINFCKKILEVKFASSIEKCMTVAEKVLGKM